MSTRSRKDVWINIRIDPVTRQEYKTAARLRGGSMSGLIHQFIVKTIREEKAANPKAFKKPPGVSLPDDEVAALREAVNPEVKTARRPPKKKKGNG